MSRPPGSYSLAEIVVALVVFILAIAILLSQFSPGLSASAKMLNNMKRLRQLTQQMALDSAARGATNIGWPGDTGGTFTNWAARLVEGHYVSTNELATLLSGPGKSEPPGRMPTLGGSAVLVYAVKASSPGRTVFLSSANFTNSPIGGVVDPAARPFGRQKFLIVRKNGEAGSLPLRELGDTNRIGRYAPLCQ